MMRNAAGVSVSCGVEKSGATQKIRCHPRRFCFNPNFEGQTGALHELVPPRSPSRPKAPYCAIILEYASSQLTTEILGRVSHDAMSPVGCWHMDVAYLNIRGTFYFIASVLDGYSRSVVHWDIREKMEECDIESILQRAREKYPGVTPRIITDNGPQFIAKDFKQFIRICGMTHVRTSPYYPQSNGKIERYHRTLNGDCVRPKVPLSKDDALRVVGEFVREYNEERLHSALGYVTPKDMLKGRQAEIHAARDQKLSEARERRAHERQEQ